jgi:hypothetical protein
MLFPVKWLVAIDHHIGNPPNEMGTGAMTCLKGILVLFVTPPLLFCIFSLLILL